MGPDSEVFSGRRRDDSPRQSDTPRRKGRPNRNRNRNKQKTSPVRQGTVSGTISSRIPGTDLVSGPSVNIPSTTLALQPIKGHGVTLPIAGNRFSSTPAVTTTDWGVPDLQDSLFAHCKWGIMANFS